ncbi:Calmodulinlike [Caligus rogercresseyi]|uniref:Calmodulinlike n=1 Tax=Caligus rogercresseyi TaxID=217165 RepID=A0A7T8HFA2_CALRO|nr:Calmodulinlike [Caligus rogercresseyi]
MAMKMGQANDEEMVRMAFRVLDRDGSGTITSAEFRHLMTNIGDKLTATEVRSLQFWALLFT